MAENDPNLEVNDDAPGAAVNGMQFQELALSYVLSKPIQAHGEEVRELKWREPTAGDIERAGNPIVVEFINERPRLTFDERKMSSMISQLTAIPPSSVRQISARDWNSIAWKLVPFFAPALG